MNTYAYFVVSRRKVRLYLHVLCANTHAYCVGLCVFCAYIYEHRKNNNIGHYGSGTITSGIVLHNGHYGSSTINSGIVLHIGHYGSGTIISGIVLHNGHYGSGTITSKIVLHIMVLVP